MTRFLLALDAGGSSTRALVATLDGRPCGRAVAGPGNPTAVGAAAALAAVRTAASSALAQAGPGEVVSAVLAAAGSERVVAFEDLRRVLDLPPSARFRRASDLLAMYYSAAVEDSGAGLIAGTGSVAARVVDGDLGRVVGGNGWLLGDAGSGFWIGRRVARAVAAALDGTGPATELLAATLETLGLEDDRRPREGRPYVLGELVDLVYAQDPVGLARLAPVCFAAAGAGDRVAAEIVSGAQDQLAALLDAVAGPGPLVVGGSVWRSGIERTDRSESLRRALAGRRVAGADDGLLGAAVLALRELGHPPTRLREQLTALAAG